MGHTQVKDLADLKEELSAIRALDGMKEKKPGIFYFKSIPFLHFHDEEGERWADVKHAQGWKRVMIPFDSNASDRKKFLKTASNAYSELASKGKKK